MEEKVVCLNVMTSIHMPNTLKLKGMNKKMSVIILVDSGGTHTFLDSQTAKDLRVVQQLNTPLRVTIENGQQMYNHPSVTKVK